MKVYIDGQFFAKNDAKISVFDHGLLYGDGVFEGIRSYNGRVFKLDEHLKRLYESAKAILLNISLSTEEMEVAVLATLRENNLRDAYIRLIVTRGEGDLGLDPDKCTKSSTIIIADTIEFDTKVSSKITSNDLHVEKKENEVDKDIQKLENLISPR